MGSAIGKLLPLALGVAISPIPIVAGLRALLSPKAKATGLVFLAGWLAGLVITLIVFTLLSSILPRRDPSQTGPIAGIIKVVLGVLVVILAVRRFRFGPDETRDRPAPVWSSITPLHGLRDGFIRSAIVPQNLLLVVAAGTVLGTAALPVDQTAVAVVVFTVIASSTVWVPVIAHLVAPQATALPQRTLREWSLRNSATARGVALLILGAFLVGNGMGSF